MKEELIIKDKFGPEYVLKVYDPKIGMEGFLVIDNTVLGPGKGGMRMTKNVNEFEIFRLARAMTWKNAIFDLPFGGAKSGIIWPSASAPAGEGDSEEQKKAFVQSFAQKIKLFLPKKYIAGPDVNTGKKEMEWFTESAGSLKTATGKPAHLCVNGGGAVKTYCGLPHELGSTGFGVAEAAIIALKAKKIPVKNAKIAIHGFGNVGFFAYKFLVEAGAKVILIAKEKGVILKEDGFNLPVIEKIFQEKKSVISDYPGAKRLSHEDFWKVPVDVLIPASITDVINEKNKKYIKAQIIVEGANIPIREEIENELWKKRILIVPDFVANAGGVISSYCEYRGYSSSEMFRMVKKKIRKITKMVLNESLKRKMNPRSVALLIAKEKIERKMK